MGATTFLQLSPTKIRSEYFSRLLFLFCFIFDISIQSWFIWFLFPSGVESILLYHFCLLLLDKMRISPDSDCQCGGIPCKGSHCTLIVRYPNLLFYRDGSHRKRRFLVLIVPSRINFHLSSGFTLFSTSLPGTNEKYFQIVISSVIIINCKYFVFHNP